MSFRLKKKQSRAVRSSTVTIKWLKTLIYVLMTTLLMVEVMLRIFPIILTPTAANIDLYRADSRLGWAFHPGAQAEIAALDVHTVVTINSHGLRDQDHDYQPPTWVNHRILVLADSFGAALQVDLQHAFPSILEQLLGDDFEVINAGVDGYGTDQEMLYYETEGRHYNADIVLLMFTLSNDARDVSEDLIVQDLWRRLRTKPYFRLEHGQLVLDTFPRQSVFRNIYAEQRTFDGCFPENNSPTCFLLQNSMILQLAFDLSSVRAINSGQVSPAPYPTNSPEWANAWELIRAMLHRLDSSVKADGAQLMVFFVGDASAADLRIRAERVARYPASADIDWLAPNRELASILDDLQIPYIDPIERFEAEAIASQLYIQGDYHWTAAGHQLVAEILNTWIRRQINDG